MPFRIVLAALSILAIAACGGGGGGTASVEPEPQPPSPPALDTDGDGVPDSRDAFPRDATETADTDGDGIGDYADAFPNDATETADTDGDGVGDNADAFPRDATETADTDGDGIGDNADAFPNDATETADTDGDGVGDNADAFPNDATRQRQLTRLPFPFLAEAGPGDSIGIVPHYDAESLPAVAAADAKHMPVYTDGAISNSAGPVPGVRVGKPRIFVGVDQGNIGGLPVAGSRGDAEIRFGQLNDGARRSELVAYLREALDADSGHGATRWRQAPAVRIVGYASERDRNRVATAVQLVNAALPDEFKLSLGGSLPAGTPATDNTIRVRFVPASPDNSGGRATVSISGAAETGWAVTDSLIQIYQDANVYRDRTDRRSVILLAHELMHSLGFSGNHPAERFATVLNAYADIYATEQNGRRQPLSLLYPIDREALRALYSLEPGADLSSLGPWASTSIHIHGNGPHTGFGVALRNGYVEPWAYGYRPNMALADNPALSGSARWTGALLGLTPDAAAVAGDAAISVNLATMTGRADFTGLETWGANAAPGAAGTGATWLDGDLGYGIAVRGNTFRETGGDAGRLTGIFTGRAHEGAAGTLEHSDLTAAFGASR